MRRGRSKSAGTILALLVALAAIGCGYSVRPPYDKNVRTVFVPIFKSVTFRRDLNLQLTEMIIKEIETRTPYKVVGSPEGADSTFEGEVVFADKITLVENPYNFPRQLIGQLTATVKWVDNRPTEDEEELSRRERQEASVISESVNFSPELGETAMLGYEKAMAKMARQIVGMMEQPW